MKNVKSNSTSNKILHVVLKSADMIRLPFNDKILKLRDSRKIAEHQIYRLEKKFAKDSRLKVEYLEILREAI
jgi:hypothetical protein